MMFMTRVRLKTLASAARKGMRTESDYRRDHLRALAQRVEVDAKEVRIIGAKSALLRTLVAASSAKSAMFGVPSSVPKWRARRDSNSRPLPSEDCGPFNKPSTFVVFRFAATRNATKTSCDYADILRTLADVLGGLALVVGMVVAIDAKQRLDAGRKESGRLPRIGTCLHEPRCRRVFERVW